MTILMRALVLGYGSALLAGLWIHAAGFGLWLAVLVAWIGGGLFSLALAWIGAALWPKAPAERRNSIERAEEFRLWDDDLAGERAAAGRRRPDGRAGGVPLTKAG